jgi:hypothetical protein
MALGAVLALALGAFVGPSTAQAAKAEESAAGGIVPAFVNNPVGVADVSTPFVQTFKFSGKNVKKKQILDVNVIVNSFGNGPGANSDLSARLVGPKGDDVALPIINLGSAMLNLQYDDQSLLVPCNPLDEISDDCNYLGGPNAAGTLGTMSGEVGASINPTFKGLNPKGEWRLIWRDADSDIATSTIGEVTIELKTGKKFAKE